MTRKPFIAGNWKLHLGPRQSSELAGTIVTVLNGQNAADVALFPTAISLESVTAALAGSGIGVGPQEICAATSGAYTGTNSAEIAREIGCTHVLVGHSERRQLFGETDKGVAEKVLTSLQNGLLPIVCVGETLQQRESGQVEAIVHGQMSAALASLSADQLASITLAYEPVWAIGTGVVATPDQAQEVHASMRGWLAANYPAYVSEEVRIQYGGSVKPGNAASLLGCPDIDGCLVGGASLKADSFAAIVQAAS
jgi:triosephosphate isomerase (TIM)